MRHFITTTVFQLRQYGRRVSIVFLAIFTAMQLSMGLANALSPDQQELFDEGINYFDISGACSADTTSTVTAGDGAPDGAAFPNLDPTGMANSINSFISQNNSSSVLGGLGETIVASAKNANINPFLIVAIAKEESSLGDPSSYNVEHANNSFGREATSSQPNYPGAGPNAGTLWYKWSSAKASVDYTAPENQNVQGGGDIATYLRDEYGSIIDSGSLLDLFMKYAPPGQNPTAQYTANVQGWISSMVNGVGGATSPSDTSPTPTTPAAATCSCSDSGTTTDAALIGSDNGEKVFNFFVGKGLTADQAAGIVGNFEQESGLNPADPGGYLAQWGGNRLSALEAFAQQQGQPVTDLAVQLDYVWLELTNGSGAGGDYSSVLTNLKGTSTVEDAVNVFAGPDDIHGNPVSPTDEVQRTGGYEDPGIPVMANRIKYANAALQQYGGGAGVGGCDGAVNCSSGSTATVSGLSETRQNVVCLAQQELALWTSGQMTPGFRSGSNDSFAKYSQNSDELWCADFVSWIYNQAGDPLQQAPNWRVPGVQSIQDIGQQNSNFHWHDPGSYTPKPGDIVVHLSGESHVNIVTAVNGDTMTLIGGDQSPNSAGYPDGSRVSQYTVTGFANTDGITGYVSPD